MKKEYKINNLFNEEITLNELITKYISSYLDNEDEYS